MSTGNSQMVLVQGAGWRRGLGNALRGELKRWFSTRRWWVQILIWAAFVNLIYFIVAVSAPRSELNANDTVMLFNIFMGIAGPVGACITMQSTVVGEKKSGTAAWVLSKPISRTAFVFSKLIANGIGVAVTMVLAQGVIAYLITLFILSIHLPILGFLAGLGVHFVNLLFYLTFTLMLGTAFEHTGPVIGIPLAFVFVQNMVMNFKPALALYLPWTLAMPANGDTSPSIALNLMTGAPVPHFLPLYITLAAIVVFIGLSVWIFNNQEF